MNHDTWFGIPIWFERIDLPDLEKLKYNFCQLQSTSMSVTRSNVGGYQSLAFTRESLKNLDLLNYIDLLEQKSRDIIFSLGNNKSLKLANGWVNINSKLSYNIWHTHPNAVLSGVLYFTYGSKILFRRPYDLMQNYLVNTIESSRNTDISFDCVHYNPEPGLVIFFPPWLEHCVETTESNELRISFAFNLVFNDNE
jgi:uncharacterized protein (TIGR02466 family)